MPTEDEPRKLTEKIIRKRQTLATYLRKTRTRSERLAVTSIFASALGALVTAGPAARGNNFITGLQQSFSPSGNISLGQVICATAFVVALVSAITVLLAQRLEKIAHLRTAEECSAELEALRNSLDLDQISLKKANEKFNECIIELSEVPLPEDGEPPRGIQPVWGRLAAAGVVVTLLVAAVAAGFAFGSRSPASTPVASVHLEGISQIGPAPFIDHPMGEDKGGEALPPWAGGEHLGGAPALYAVPSGGASCDRADLAFQLDADHAKAAAWVRPMGIGVQDIDAFVNSLTPVLLRADTAVTDYGYPNGSTQSYASILQAGTAVLINSYGEPTVKCVSGDPLGRPTSFNDSNLYTGDSWSGFQAGKVCTIAPAPTEVAAFVVVELPSGDHVSVTAKPDLKTVKGPNPDPAEAHPNTR
jgi:hypothetical protein